MVLFVQIKGVGGSAEIWMLFGFWNPLEKMDAPVDSFNTWKAVLMSELLQFSNSIVILMHKIYIPYVKI